MSQLAPNAATRDANGDVMINAKRGTNDDSALHKAPAHEPPWPPPLEIRRQPGANPQ